MNKSKFKSKNVRGSLQFKKKPTIKNRAEKKNILTPSKAASLVFQLKSGLKGVLKHDSRADLASVYVRIAAGSIFEKEYAGSGISHFLEHGVFLGSRLFKEREGFSKRLEKWGGGDTNAYTSFDCTAYFATVFSSKIKLTLEAFFDLVKKPLLKTKDVHDEQGTIESEMDMYENKVESLFHQNLFSFVYPNLPYRYPVIGDRRLFKGLHARDLRLYHKKSYKDENITLSVVGKINSKRTLGYIEKIFGSPVVAVSTLAENTLAENVFQTSKDDASSSAPIKGRQKENIKANFKDDKVIAIRRLFENRSCIEQRFHKKALFPMAIFTWPFPGSATGVSGQEVRVKSGGLSKELLKQRFLPGLTASFLLDGHGTPLYERIKMKKKLAQNLYAYAFHPQRQDNQDYSCFFIEMQFQKQDTPLLLQKRIRECLQEINAELHRILALKKSKALSNILEGLKNEALKETVDEHESLLEKASSLAAGLSRYGIAEIEKQELAAIGDISFSDIKRCIETIFFKVLKQPLLSVLSSEELYKKGMVFSKGKLLPETLALALAKKKSLVHRAGNTLPVFLKQGMRSYEQSPSSSLLASNKKQTLKLVTENSTKNIKKEMSKEILSNGLCFVSQRKLELPKVSLVIRFKGGQAAEVPESLEHFSEMNKEDLLYRNRKKSRENMARDAGQKAGSFSMLCRMLETSNAQFSRKSFAAFIKQHALDFMSFCSSDSFGISLSYLKEKHAEAMQVLKAVCLEPHSNAFFSLKDFQQEKQACGYAIKKNMEKGNYISSLALKKMLYGASPSPSPYARMMSGTLETLLELRREDIYSVFNLYVRSDSCFVSLKGDFSLTEREQLRREFLLQLPAAEKKQSLRKRKVATPPSVKVMAQPVKPRSASGIFGRKNFLDQNLQALQDALEGQEASMKKKKKKQDIGFLLEYDKGSLETIVKIGFNLPVIGLLRATEKQERSRKISAESKRFLREVAKLELIKTYFQGMGSPLFALRSVNFVKNGVSLGGRAYSLGCLLNQGRDFCSLIFYAKLRKEAYAEYPWILQAFFSEIRKFSNKKLNLLSLTKTKNLLTASFLRSRLSMQALVAKETMYEHYGLDYRCIEAFPALVESLEAVEIQAYAKKWLDEGRAAVHVLQGKQHAS